MKLFEQLQTTGLEEAKDSTGSFKTIPSDVYAAEVKIAYADEARSGARNMTIVFNIPELDREFTETIYITNREGKHYYEANGKKNPLPGFTMVNDIAYLTTGKELFDQTFEDKLVEIYNFEMKKKIPTAKPVASEMVGKQIYIAILDVEEPKRVQVGGNWVDSTTMVHRNKLDKVFDYETNKTTHELRNNIEATFGSKWLEINKDKTRVVKPKGTPVDASAATPAPVATKSLFAK